MRRGDKPTKPRVGAESSVARRSLKNEDPRVHELEKRLAKAVEREAEALKRRQVAVVSIRLGSPVDCLK